MKIQSIFRLFCLAVLLVLGRTTAGTGIQPKGLLVPGKAEALSIPEKESRRSSANDPGSVTVSYVTSSILDGSYTIGQSIPILVVFSDVVIVSGSPSLLLSTGSPSTTSLNYGGGSGTNTLTFDYSVASGNTSADLDYAGIDSLQLNGGTIQDVGSSPVDVTLPTPGGLNSLAGRKDIIVDTTPPGANLSTTAHDPTNLDPIPVSLDFSEAVTDFDLGNISTLNATASNLHGSGANYTFDLTPAGQGLVTASLPANKAHDIAGNGNTASNTLSLTFDSQAPTVTFTLQGGSDTGISQTDLLTNASSLVFDATFSEPVSGFTFDDLSNTGTAGGCVFSVGTATGDTYPVTVSSCSEGSVIVDLPAGKVNDAAGNENAPTSGPTVTIDRTGPSVTLTSSAGAMTNLDPIPVNVHFSETVYDFTSGDVSFTNAALGGLTGSGMDYSFSLTPAAQGPVTAGIAVDKVQDAAGNGNTTSNTLNVTYDSLRPTVSLTTSAPNPTRLDPIPVTVTFDEPVTGFTLSDITATNATPANLQGSGANYTFELTGVGQGLVNASIAAGGAQDAAGNTNMDSNHLSLLFDTISPSVMLSTTAPNSTNTSPIPLAVHFSEAVTDFTSLAISLTNATVSGFSGSGTDYSVQLTPSGQGILTVSIAAGAAHDAAGNPNMVSNLVSLEYDTLGPTVTLSSTAPDPTRTSPIPVTVTFSESVTDFDSSDITLTNASVSNFSGSGTSYTIQLTPSGDGIVSILVAAGKAHDAAGNPNSAATPLSRTVDTTPPSVVMSSSTPDPTNQSAITVTVTFSEPVTGFTESDLQVSSHWAESGFSGSGAVYTFTLTFNGAYTDTVDIPAGVAEDAAGNFNTAAVTFRRTYDGSAPAVAFSLQSASDTGYSNTDNITKTVAPIFNAVFDEAVTGFDASDLSNSGTAANCNFQITVLTPSSYTVTASSCGEGTLILHLGAGLVTDLAGNGNGQTSGPVVTIDRTAPTVTLNTGASNPTNVSPIPVTIAFDENVTGFTLTDLSLVNGSTAALNGSGASYSFNLTPTTQGDVTASVAAGVAQDLAGNDNLASNMLTRTYDSVSPSVSLATSAPNPTNSSPVPLSVHFSETVADFTSTDLTLVNAAVTNFSGTGTDYSVELTPLGQGLVSASIAAGMAHDAAGNPNTPSNTLSLTFDSLSPTVTFSLLAASDTGTSATDNITNATTLSFTAAFSEPVTGFAAGALSNTGGASGCIIQVGTPAGNNYPVDLTGCTSGTVILHLAAASVTDLAGNTNGLTTGPTVTIDRTAPTVTFSLQPASDRGPSSTDNITNATSPVFDAVFSETIDGFAPADLINHGTAVDCTFSIGAATGNTYPVTASSCSEGTLVLQMAAAGVTDIAGNPILLTDGPTVTLDRTAPTVSFNLEAASDSGPSNTDNLTNVVSPIIDANFSEPISGLTAGSLSNTGTATGCVFNIGMITANTYPVTASTCSEGTIILNLAAASLTDMAGNSIAQSAGSAITIDRTAPSVTYTLQTASDSGVSNSDRITNAAILHFDAGFSEPVTGFSPNELTNEGTAAACAFAISGPTGNNYVATVTSCGEGTLILHSSAGTATDMAGNVLPAASSAAVTIDRTAPTVGFTLRAASDSGPFNNDNYTNAASLTFDAAFSEGVSGFVPTNLSNFGTAAGCTFAIGAPVGNIYPVTASSCLEGTLILRMVSAGVTDTAGNPILQTDGPTVTLDRTAPTVSIGLQAASDTGFSSTDNLTNAANLIFNAAFSESVYGFEPADLANIGTAANCSFSIGSLNAGNYPLTVSGCAEGTVVVRLSATGITDLAGNPNLQTISPTVTIDRTAPTISMGSTVTDPTGISPIPVTVTFSESVTGFASSDIAITNATINEFLGSGASYSFNLYPQAAGAVTASIAAATAQDLAGNNNTAALPFSRTYDNVAPAVSMTSAAPATTNLAIIPVTVTFSKSVTGFILGDITVSNGSANTLQGSGTTYTFNLVPGGQGTVSADIAANAAQDSAGNGNTAAPRFSRVYDSIAPTVTFDLQDGSDTGFSSTDNLTNAANLIFNAAFSEPVTDFSVDDLSNIGSATGCTFAITAPLVNVYPVTASGCSNGTVILRLASNGVLDAALNGNIQTDQTYTVTIDRIAPVATIVLEAASDAGVSSSDHVTNALAPIFDVSFSKTIVSLPMTDFASIGTATGCSISVGSLTGGKYPVTVSSCSEGTLTLRLDGGLASDAAGNTTVQTDGPLTTLDRTAPSFSAVAPISSAFINNVTTASEIGFSISENLGSGSLTITWTGGVNDPTPHLCTFNGSTLNAGSHTLNLADTSNGCTAAQALVSNARYSFAFNGVDIAGNSATQVLKSNVTFDETPPVITISAPSVAGTKNGPVTFTVNYSDLNFNSSTLTASNVTLIKTGSADGTVSVDGGTGASRTITISGASGNGTLAISIAAGTASDKAGNQASASGSSATFIVDNVNPTIHWIGPTTDGNPYDVYNQVVHLVVNPTDEMGVAKVVFSWWDKINLHAVEIGTVYNPPYGIDFDTSVLPFIPPGGPISTWNQVTAIVYDYAGNWAYSYIFLNDIPALKVNKSGSGGGTVTSSPPGINCGSICLDGYNAGTVVTLTATPDGSSLFIGWSGACSGTGTCQVTLGEDKTVVAIFSNSHRVYLPLIYR